MTTDTREALAALVDKDLTFFDGYVDRHQISYGEVQQARAALATQPAAQPSAQGEAVACDKWEGAEEWMPLAWELCADECGEEACTELVWEGGPVPEPWGDRWLKYEGEAKRLIALVRKHVPAAQPSALGAAHAVPNELTTKQIEEIAFAVLRSRNDDRLWRALTYDSGPYDVTKATLALQDLAAAFFRAGLASAPAAPAQAVPQQDICCEGDCHYYGQKRPSTCCCSKGG